MGISELLATHLCERRLVLAGFSTRKMLLLLDTKADWTEILKAYALNSTNRGKPGVTSTAPIGDTKNLHITFSSK
jgi:hypothetical protein